MLTYTIFHSSLFVGYLATKVSYHPFAFLLEPPFFSGSGLPSLPPPSLGHAVQSTIWAQNLWSKDIMEILQISRGRAAAAGNSSCLSSGKIWGQGSRQNLTLKMFRASFSVGGEWGHWCFIVLHRSRAGWVIERTHTTLLGASEISYEQRGDQAWVFSSLKPWSR